MTLESKTAIITGAGAGIGNATAQRFAAEGATVIADDVKPEYLGELLSNLSGDRHLPALGDSSLEETAQRAARAALGASGRVGVLVNNVGHLFFGDSTSITVEQWGDLVRTNVRSPFVFSKAAIPPMLEQGAGSIINVASISSFIGQEMNEQSSLLFNIAKAAVRQMATSLATRYAKEGVRLNAVVPGPTRTLQVRPSFPTSGPRWKPRFGRRQGRPACRWGASGGPRRSRPRLGFWPPTMPRS